MKKNVLISQVATTKKLATGGQRHEPLKLDGILFLGELILASDWSLKFTQSKHWPLIGQSRSSEYWPLIGLFLCKCQLGEQRRMENVNSIFLSSS